MTQNTQKAIVYCRVSSKEQADEGYSLDSQEKLLTEYAASHDLSVAKVYRIAETASKYEVRKKFNEMLEFANGNSAKTILCEKIDRLTRNLKDAAVINDWVYDDQERSVHFVKENFIVNKNTKAHENLVWDMKVAISRFYASNLSEEVRKGQIEKLEQGWMPRQAPLGYQTIGESKHKIHIINPDIAPYIKQAFETYSTGLYSLHDLSDKMYENGLRSVNGMKISASNMRLILRNPFYFGEIRWNGKTYKGNQESIISKELFDQCQRIMTGTRPDKYVKHNPLFKGLAVCGECGHKVSWYEKKGFWYGRCANYKGCQQAKMPLKEDFLLDQVFSHFQSLMLSESDIQKIKENLKSDHAEEMQARKDIENDIARKLAKNNSKLDVLYQDRLENRISIERYDELKADIENDTQELLEARKKLQENTIDYFDLGINLMELARKIKELFPYAEKEEKQEMLTLAFNRMTITDKVLKIEYTPWFAKLQNHVPALAGSCELLKAPVIKQQSRALATLRDSWLGR